MGMIVQKAKKKRDPSVAKTATNDPFSRMPYRKKEKLANWYYKNRKSSKI